MLYLAILLVLCGLLIIITALFVETGAVPLSGELNGGWIRKADKSRSARPDSAELPPEEVDIIFPGDRYEKPENKYHFDDTFVSFDDEKSDRTDEDRYYGRDDEIPDLEDYYSRNQRPVSPAVKDDYSDFRRGYSPLPEDDNIAVTAVMFDDKSNIIDYESGSAVIDSTFSKYKSIKRIGRGRIESDFDGVSFYLGEKLYRFDFHKVYDIWSGSDYVALPLKGNSTVKLFLIENSPAFPDEVEANFKEFEKGL